MADISEDLGANEVPVAAELNDGRRSPWGQHGTDMAQNDSND